MFFQIKAEWGCNSTSVIENLVVAQFILQTDPVQLDSTSFSQALAYQFGIAPINIEIIDIIRDDKPSDGPYSIVIVIIYAYDALGLSSIQSYLNTLSQSLPKSLSFDSGNNIISNVFYSSSFDCNNCNNGICHFGKCVCNDGYSGTNCANNLLVGTVVTITMDFGNFVANAFIIGICFLFVGVFIGFVVFKIRYKLKRQM